MRIRTQLVILVLAVIAPVAMLAAVATVGLWELQRDAYQQRFLERVSALRLALDTELEAIVRQLRALSESTDMDAADAQAQFQVQAERLLRNHPSWGTIALLGSDGSMLSRLDRRAALRAADLDPVLAAEVRSRHSAAISDLRTVAGGTVHVTHIAVPVFRGTAFRGVLFIAIEHTAWLEFFKRYPIHERATLTLNDRDARIIVRTLNNDQWAGKRSTAAFWGRTAGRTEGAFLNVGVDGQRFYSAFSRSRTAAWIVSTGVPQDDVEAALSRPTFLIVFSVLAAGGIATLLAFVLGGRITGALTGLARSVKSVTIGGHTMPQEPLPIEEAETVRQALLAAAELLSAREASLNQALSREAQSRAAAERASQAKDDLLAMLGHELRNPISAIKAAVTLIEMAGSQPETARRAHQVVRRQIGHLTAIIDELLDVARLNSGKAILRSAHLDLSVVARHVIDAFADSGRCANLLVETDLKPVFVNGDETRLEQVVSNLLDNACKYTPAGGRVQISVHEQDGSAVLTVRDSGSGISAELLPHVFDLFAQGHRTLDRSQGGLGLGLTVVRRLVGLHGGTIGASSAGAEQGATFTLTLPAAAQQTPGQAHPPAPVALMPLRIAVVEDNADNRDFVAQVLRMKGHSVIEAGDGMGGVQAILADRVDVALVDIGLPGWDGYEVARRVRATPAGASLLLIALTGYGRDEDRVRAIDAGFDAFLIKPFDIAKFTTTVAGLQRTGARVQPAAKQRREG